MFSALRFWRFWLLYRGYLGAQVETNLLNKQVGDHEGFYRQLFGRMSDGVAICEILCDESGRPCDYRFLEVNKAFEEQTGLVAKDIVGKSALARDSRLGQFDLQYFAKLLFEPESKAMVDGIQWGLHNYEATAVSLDGNKFAWILEAKQEPPREEGLKGLNATKSADELINGAAHELKQPLSAINTYASVALRMLDSGLKQPEEFRQAVIGARDQAVRASQLLSQLSSQRSSSSKEEGGGRKPTD